MLLSGMKNRQQPVIPACF